MSDAIHLLMLAGSTREQSYNRRLAGLALTFARANGIAATLADLADYPMPIYDGDLEATEGVPENARKLHALFGVHDGILIASPEYNASITPLLKNTLDWVSRVKVEGAPPLAVYRGRAFALISASPGGFGGMRGLMHTRQILEIGLSALVIPETLSVPGAAAAFDADGHLKDKTQQVRLGEVVKALAGMAARLRT
jgi:NAD(P)H-dependent FMN reductase